MPQPPKIWIVNESGHRYYLAPQATPDVEMGAQMPVLTHGNVNQSQVDRLAFALAEKISAETTAEDYLLLSGAPILNALACSLWLLQHGSVRLLIWEARNDGYVFKVVERQNLERILSEPQG